MTHSAEAGLITVQQVFKAFSLIQTTCSTCSPGVGDSDPSDPIFASSVALFGGFTENNEAKSAARSASLAIAANAFFDNRDFGAGIRLQRGD